MLSSYHPVLLPHGEGPGLFVPDVGASCRPSVAAAGKRVAQTGMRSSCPTRTLSRLARPLASMMLTTGTAAVRKARPLER